MVDIIWGKHILCDLSRFSFWLSMMLLQYILVAVYINSYLYSWVVFHDIDMTVFLPVYLLRDILIVFRCFFYPKYSSCEHSYTGFFIYLGKMPSSVILESYDKRSIMFQRDCQTIFHSGLSILHSYQQCMRDSIYCIFARILYNHYFAVLVL